MIQKLYILLVNIVFVVFAVLYVVVVGYSKWSAFWRNAF